MWFNVECEERQVCSVRMNWRYDTVEMEYWMRQTEKNVMGKLIVMQIVKKLSPEHVDQNMSEKQSMI